MRCVASAANLVGLRGGRHGVPGRCSRLRSRRVGGFELLARFRELHRQEGAAAVIDARPAGGFNGLGGLIQALFEQRVFRQCQ